MTFIPNKSLKHTFKYVDTMFNNWFTRHGHTFSSVAGYFVDFSTFTSDQVLLGMMWMYYNYPIDWLLFNNQSGNYNQNDWYIINIYKLVCFVKKSAKALNRQDIYKITKDFVPEDQRAGVIDPLFDSKEKFGIDWFVKRFPKHMFNDISIITLIKKRESRQLFGSDADLVAILNKKLVNAVKADLAEFSKTQQKLADETERNRKNQMKRDMMLAAAPKELPKMQKTEKKNFLQYTGDYLY